jgi:hypothetical protein
MHPKQLWFERQRSRRCVFCQDDIPSLLNKAHHHHKNVRVANRHWPGIDDTYDLCWSYHLGLLHAGIIRHCQINLPRSKSSRQGRAITPPRLHSAIR